MNEKPSSSRKPRFPRQSGNVGSRHGFALVVTLSLMVLLTIIALGLLSLSSIALRSADRGGADAQARSNARMALMMAIGGLQREMGPDSRISAPHDAGSPSGGQAHWIAVYDAWKNNPDPGVGVTPQSRVPQFRGWLVSGADGGTGDMARMVGPGTLGSGFAPDDQVEVPMQQVSSTQGSGRIAWWVSDESAKAKVNAGPDSAADPAFGTANAMLNAQSPPNVGHRSFAKLEDLTWQSGRRAITVSTNQLNLATGLGPAKLGGAFHDITVHSAGVLADVRSGRLKRDLSNLLSRDVEEIENMPLYLDDGFINNFPDGLINRFAITEDGAVSNQPGFPGNYGALPGWGINLEELSLFHNLYREIEWNGQEPHLDPKDTREAMVRDRFNLYRQPVLEAVHCIFSLSAVPDGGTASGGAPTYKMKMMLDGMIALSNPNDISMEWPSGPDISVGMNGFFYDLKWNITRSGQAHNTKNITAINSVFFSGKIPGGFTLLPGEGAVFGSSTSADRFVTLARGFAPSGGVDVYSAVNGTYAPWDLKAGGLMKDDVIDFTLVKDTGPPPTAASGYTIYGKNVDGWTFATLKLSGNSLVGPLMDKLLIKEIQPPQKLTVEEFIDGPMPVMMVSFLQNVEQSQPRTDLQAIDAVPSRPFYFAEPAISDRRVNAQAVDIHSHSLQWLTTAEGMNYEFGTDRTLPAGEGGRYVYHGGGRQAGFGSFKVIKRRIPIVPPLSLGAFENAIAAGFRGRYYSNGKINPPPPDGIALDGRAGASPSIAKAIGNSWANSFMPSDQVSAGGYTDPSWMANTALWDQWFLSGIVDGRGTGSSPWMSDSRSPRAQFRDLAEGTGSLRNKRYLFHRHKPLEQVMDDLFDGEDFKPAALNKLANYLLVDGVFNVNSTSVGAWKALLTSVRNQDLLTGAGTPQSTQHPFGTLGYASGTATAGSEGDWNGFRDLTEAEMDGLATAVVAEVKARGPFLNLADFVNRRPDSSVPAERAVGALQAAIDKSGLNSRFTGGGRSLTADDIPALAGNATLTDEPNPARAIGAAGYLSQAALLTSIGSQITVRGDTFSIRAYGDHRNADGDILAKAWCEAVVQRVPEYIDPADEPQAQDGWPTSTDKLAPANSEFGRKFEIRSFRWLNPGEV